MDGENQENRQYSRKRCYCRTIIEPDGNNAFLSDISERGFKTRIPSTKPIVLDFGVLVHFIPDIILDIPEFRLFGSVKWKLKEEKSWLLGFEVETFPCKTDEDSYNLLMNIFSRS